MLNQRPPAGQPPTAQAGAAREVECTNTSGANVLLDASASFDPDSTPGTADDKGRAYHVWYRAVDGAGNSTLAERVVTVPLSVNVGKSR